MHPWDRRRFLQGSAALGGSLLTGIGGTANAKALLGEVPVVDRIVIREITDNQHNIFLKPVTASTERHAHRFSRRVARRDARKRMGPRAPWRSLRSARVPPVRYRDKPEPTPERGHDWTPIKGQTSAPIDNLAPLPLIGGRIGGPYELTPPVVPVRTFFCRSRTRYLLAGGFLRVLRRGFRQPQEPRRCPCSSGTRYHRPTSGAEPRPGAWRPRRWLDASRAAEPPACPTPSATTISCCG